MSAVNYPSHIDPNNLYKTQEAARAIAGPHAKEIASANLAGHTVSSETKGLWGQLAAKIYSIAPGVFDALSKLFSSPYPPIDRFRFTPGSFNNLDSTQQNHLNSGEIVQLAKQLMKDPNLSREDKKAMMKGANDRVEKAFAWSLPSALQDNFAYDQQKKAVNAALADLEKSNVKSHN